MGPTRSYKTYCKAQQRAMARTEAERLSIQRESRKVDNLLMAEGVRVEELVKFVHSRKRSSEDAYQNYDRARQRTVERLDAMRAQCETNAVRQQANMKTLQRQSFMDFLRPMLIMLTAKYTLPRGSRHAGQQMEAYCQHMDAHKPTGYLSERRLPPLYIGPPIPWLDDQQLIALNERWCQQLDATNTEAALESLERAAKEWKCAVRIQAAFRAWRWRRHVLWDPHSEIGRRHLQQVAARDCLSPASL